MGTVRLPARTDWGGIELVLDGASVGETGPEGNFVILGVTPGRHELTARRHGYLSARRTVDASARGATIAGEALLVAGDTYRDERVDTLDLVTIMASYGRCSGGASYQAWLDLDGDDCIGSGDLDILTSSFGAVGPVPWAPVQP